MKYHKNKFNRLVDIILSEEDINPQLRRDAITELREQPLTQEMLNKISRSERLYGGLPEDLRGLVEYKNDQRLNDVGAMIEDLEENLNITNLKDFCLFLGIPEDSKYHDIMDKAHIAARSGKARKPRSVEIVE